MSDFEKALENINTENKALLRKVTSNDLYQIVYYVTKLSQLDNGFEQQKQELVSLVSEHERNVSRKNEQLNRAIFDICRQLKINNPLISPYSAT